MKPIMGNSNGTANGKGLLVDRASQGNVVNRAAIILVPAGNNDSSLQEIFVVVADLTKEGGGGAHIRRLSLLHPARGNQ